MNQLITSLVHLHERPRLPELSSFGDLLNARDAFNWLVESSNFIGWTYAITEKVWTFLHPSQIITDRHDFAKLPKEIRLASCCHLKCYVAEGAVLIGSFNLTAPTIEDLCVLIEDKRVARQMRAIFKSHWKALV